MTAALPPLSAALGPVASVRASIPSPPASEIHLGPFPLRAYAVAIILGVVVAVVVGDRRWRARGGRPGFVLDVATVAVPVGIVGARLYHVVTTPDPYFGPGGNPLDALQVWEGGLGIWGGIAAGTLAAWLMLRREGLPLGPFADAVAPGVALAQAVGRFGNWANQELYGRPTDLPWALEIDPEHRPAATPDSPTYHPTFLYESLWNTGVALLVIWADRRFRLGGGRAAALYVAAYCAGRLWIEALRVDTAERVLGLRLNIWTALLVGLAAVAFLVLRRGNRQREVRQEDPDRAGSDRSDQGRDAAAGSRDGDTPTAGGA